MPIALEDLRRARCRLEPEGLAGDALHLGCDRRVGADGARELSDREPGEGMLEARAVPFELEHPAEELQAERGRLGVHPVRAPDGHRVAVLLGPSDDYVRGPDEPVADERAGALDREREGGVENVGRGEAVVEPAPFRPELGSDGVHERRDVVVRRPLELRDPFGRGDSCALANRPGTRNGNRANLRPCVDDGELDVQPALEPGLVGPDPGHVGSGVASDHRGDLRWLIGNESSRSRAPHVRVASIGSKWEEARGGPRVIVTIRGRPPLSRTSPPPPLQPRCRSGSAFPRNR